MKQISYFYLSEIILSDGIILTFLSYSFRLSLMQMQFFALEKKLLRKSMRISKTKRIVIKN